MKKTFFVLSAEAGRRLKKAGGGEKKEDFVKLAKLGFRLTAGQDSTLKKPPVFI